MDSTRVTMAFSPSLHPLSKNMQKPIKTTSTKFAGPRKLCAGSNTPERSRAAGQSSSPGLRPFGAGARAGLDSPGCARTCLSHCRRASRRPSFHRQLFSRLDGCAPFGGGALTTSAGEPHQRAPRLPSHLESRARSCSKRGQFRRLAGVDAFKRTRKTGVSSSSGGSGSALRCAPRPARCDLTLR